MQKHLYKRPYFPTPTRFHCSRACDAIHLAAWTLISIFLKLFEKNLNRLLITFWSSRRLDMITSSPIFSHFTETVTGASSIRYWEIGARGAIDTRLAHCYIEWTINWFVVQLYVRILTPCVMRSKYQFIRAFGMTERFVEESINLGKTYDKLIIFYWESLLNRPFPSILPVLTFTRNSSSLQDI